MASKRINLNQLEVYSTDSERISNSIKRVIQFSDTEEKLFSCFDWYRDKAASKDKAQWDRCFGHFVNREMGRMHISQDFASKLKENLEKQTYDFQNQHSVEKNKTDAQKQLNVFITHIRSALKVDETTEYADKVKAGHYEAMFLGRVLDTLWKHQEKYLAVLNDTSGNAQMSMVEVRDRTRDFARYLDSRANWKGLQEQQAVLKAKLDLTGKQKRNAKKREKKRTNKEMTGNDSGSDMRK